MGRTLAEKLWDGHVVRSAEGEPDLLYIDLHLLHEVTSPQAFEGLRLAGRTVRRPDLTLATEDHNVPTIDQDKPIADLGQPHPGGDAAPQRRGVRRPAAPARRHRAGHRAHHQSPAGPDPAGHDHRLRRQPHEHPRRVRRPGLRDRHLRGRARAGHPDAAPGAAQDDGRHRQRQPARRRHRQGPGADADHAGGHRRRPGVRRGVPRPGHRGALDGGPDDGVQHEHRVGRQGRAHRTRPDDVRLPRGSRRGAEGRGVGRGRRGLAVADDR